MIRFLEDPLPTILLGTAALSLLWIAYLQTRRGLLLMMMGLALLLTLGGLVLERVVATSKERVEQTIYGLAAAVEEDDYPKAMRYVAPTAKKLRGEAKYYMSLANVDRARVIGKIEIVINQQATPPQAQVGFDGLVHGTSRRDGHALGGRFKFTVDLQEQPDGNWQVVDYARSPR